MAWTDLAAKIDDLMQTTLKYTEAPALFSVELVPDTIADHTYCLVPTGLDPNTEFTDKSDRFYPLAGYRISIIFELGANSPTLRDASMKGVEDVVRTLINPANRSSLTRQVHFLGTRSKLLTREGFWIIYDMDFRAEYILVYN